MGRLKHFDRLRTSREFDAVYRRADTTWHTPYFVLFFRKDPSQYRVGFVAGKKVGNAVRRNRAKRLLRALFLDQIDSRRPGTYILIAKALIHDASFATLTHAMRKALDRADAPPKSPRAKRPARS